MKSHTFIAFLLLGSGVLAADFECRWAASPPKIDGKLDDPAWKNAQAVEQFTSSWLEGDQRTPPTKTKARLLWDREYLYFSAEMEDTDLFANVTEQDGAIWSCDVFELFFKPAKDKTGYYEFEVNAANGKLDMFLPSRGSGGYARHKTERDFHIESAVQLRGTLNNWSDKDKGWTVEGRIPWRDFLSTGGRPAPGEVWQHALCRYDYSTGLENAALSSSAPLSAPDFHHYEDYLPLKFIGPHEGAAVKHEPWNTSKLAGSPEPPPPYRTANAFPKLTTAFPITIKVEPGGHGFLLFENNGYGVVRKSRLVRIADPANVAQPDLLLEFDESIYDIAFHPKFTENGYVFITANGRFGEGRMDFNNRILRYKMDRKTGLVDADSRTVILEFHSHGHNGMGIAFGKDGMLYVTSGDGTSDSDEWGSGQDLTRLLAKMLRIDVDHPAAGQNYGIPADNPFLKVAGARPETWSYGFRNPWRMSIDTQTGDIWVGENGQDLWEYARIVHGGENYGWPVVEGSHPFHQNRKPGPTPLSKPLIEHPHTDFRSLTGGIVYHGSKFPDLAGSYVYGDYSTGQIWAAKQEKGELVSDMLIARTSLAIANFCETPEGDILVVDYTGNAIHKLERNLETVTATRPPFPAKLSESGLFTDTAALKPHPGLIHYEVNAPAWHDGASSDRYIALPPDGRMEVTPQGGWNFPDGSALVQTLSLSGKRLESRVLLRQQNVWAGYSYQWNAAQTDAVLLPAAGETTKEWRYPSRQECALCHSRESNFALSVNTIQLNRKAKDGNNQIANWERDGLLQVDHAKIEEAEWRDEIGKKKLGDVPTQALLDRVLRLDNQRKPELASLLPKPADELPSLANPDDKSQPLQARARSYLHTNCSHCHMPNAGGNSAMKLAFQVKDDEMQIVNAQPMHGTLTIPEARLVVPGDPARSLLLYRPTVRGSFQMPPIGTQQPDPEGTSLLAQWIAGMEKK